MLEDGADAEGGAASAAAADADASAGVYELLTPEEWQGLALHYGLRDDDGGGGGFGGRKRARGGGGGGGQAPASAALRELLERGIEARLEVEPPAGQAQTQAQGGSPGAAGGEQPAAGGQANGPAGGGGGGRRGRAAAVRAEAAAADSGSEDGLSGEWQIGSASNPYALQRRKNTRQGARASGVCEVGWMCRRWPPPPLALLIPLPVWLPSEQAHSRPPGLA